MPEILGEALEFDLGTSAVIVNVTGDVKSVNGKSGDVTLKTSDLENDSGYVSESGVEVTSHQHNHTGDTSWILLKIPRSRYKLSFHNCSGDDGDSPTTLVSNPKTWLEGHLAFFLAHNCNFGGAEWGSRWGGQEYARNLDPSLFPTPRNYFAFDSETEECAYYPASIYDSENLLSAIPAKYDVVFACGDPFVLNGVPNTGGFNLDGGTGTRTAFGWDADYYYILSGEGRGTYERGLTLDEVKAIFVSHGAANAVNFDGGGSVCLAARIGGRVEKINRFRDASLTYPGLRKVGLCAAYERRASE